MTVSGAYGRDYGSLAAMKADWDAGKDFQIRSVDGPIGAYCSKRDMQGKEVWGRYKKDTEIGCLQSVGNECVPDEPGSRFVWKPGDLKVVK